jgi:hypothetical protein
MFTRSMDLFRGKYLHMCCMYHLDLKTRVFMYSVYVADVGCDGHLVLGR